MERKYCRAAPASPEYELYIVAGNFVELQEMRHKADYDLEEPWTYVEAGTALALAETAFESWERVKTEPIAQDYLFSLLFKERA